MADPGYRLVRAERPPVAAPVLDDAQRRVVEHAGGPLLVLAGPGTGKTTTLVEAAVARVDAGVPVEHLLMLTFSRRAAGELRDRVAARLGRTVREPIARTIHSYAFGVLRLANAARGLPAPRLLAAAEQDVVLRDLLAERDPGAVAGRAASGAAHGRLRRRAAQPAHARRRARAHRPGAGRSRPGARASGLGGGRRVPRRVPLRLRDEGPRRVRPGRARPGRAQRAATTIRRCSPPSASGGGGSSSTSTRTPTPRRPSCCRCSPKGADEIVLVGDPDQSIYAFRGADETAMRDVDERFGAGADGAGRRAAHLPPVRPGAGRRHPPDRRAAARAGRAARDPGRRRAAGRTGRDGRLPHRERGGRLHRRGPARRAPRRAAVVADGGARPLHHPVARHAAPRDGHRGRAGRGARRRHPARRPAGRAAHAGAAALRARPGRAHRRPRRDAARPARSAAATRSTCAGCAGCCADSSRTTRARWRRCCATGSGANSCPPPSAARRCGWPGRSPPAPPRWPTAPTPRPCSGRSGRRPGWPAAGRRRAAAAARPARRPTATSTAWCSCSPRPRTSPTGCPTPGPDQFAEHVRRAADPGRADGRRRPASPTRWRILTAHASKGLEWDLVCVANVQEGSWPDLRRRGSLLGTEALVDAVRGIDVAPGRLARAAARRGAAAVLRRDHPGALAARRHRGRRRRGAAVAAARRTRPGRGRPPAHRAPIRGVHLPGLVAELRAVVCADDVAGRRAAGRRGRARPARHRRAFPAPTRTTGGGCCR